MKSLSIHRCISSKCLILSVLGLALVLRLIAINQSLWLDEAIGAIIAKDFSYSKIFTDFMLVDNHPPLYYLILKAWTSFFGYSETSIRFPSIIFGLGTIYIAYKILSDLDLRRNNGFGESVSEVIPTKLLKPAIIAPIILAISQFSIYYSQEARMYSQATFFVALAVRQFIISIDNNRNKINGGTWLLFSISIVLLFFTDYMSFFVTIAFWLYAIITIRDRDWWRLFIFSHIPLLILGLFWLPTLMHQFEGGNWLIKTSPLWTKIAGGANIKEILLVWTKFVWGRVSLINKRIYYLILIFVSLPYIFSIKYYFVNNKLRSSIFTFWVFIPLISGLLLSFIFPVFIYFRYLFIFPAFIMISVIGAFLIKSKIVRNIVILLLIFIQISSTLLYYLDSNQHRENWRDATSFVESAVKEEEIILFDYPEPFAPYRWYSKEGNNSFGATDSIVANEEISREKTMELINGKQGIYFFEYLKEISDPNDIVKSEIEKYFEVKNIFNFNGVGLIYYYVRN